MKIFLTGATGYVGSRVARRLIARGDEVTGLVRHQSRMGALPSGVEPAVGDLAAVDRIVGEAKAADAVIHTGFAAHGRDWAAAVEIERELVLALAVTLKEKGASLIVSNGTAFYGDAGGWFLDETHVPPSSHPAHSRVGATAPAYATPGLRGMELRLASFVYGDGGSIFLPILASHARRTGQSLYVGRGDNRVSAVHVEAAADAYLAALDYGRAGSIYHVVSDDAPRMAELATAIAIGTGARAVSVTSEEAARALDSFTAMFLALDNGISSRKARAELVWSPAGHPGLLWDVAHGSYAKKAGMAVAPT